MIRKHFGHLSKELSASLEKFYLRAKCKHEQRTWTILTMKHKIKLDSLLRILPSNQQRSQSQIFLFTRSTNTNNREINGFFPSEPASDCVFRSSRKMKKEECITCITWKYVSGIDRRERGEKLFIFNELGTFFFFFFQMKTLDHVGLSINGRPGLVTVAWSFHKLERYCF